MLVEDVEEVVCVLFPNAFDSKIVHDQGEPYGSPFMSEEAWRVLHFVVPMYLQTLLEEFVGQSARLRKAINASDDSHVDVPIFDFAFQVVFFDEVFGDEG